MAKFVKPLCLMIVATFASHICVPAHSAATARLTSAAPASPTATVATPAAPAARAVPSATVTRAASLGAAPSVTGANTSRMSSLGSLSLPNMSRMPALGLVGTTTGGGDVRQCVLEGGGNGIQFKELDVWGPCITLGGGGDIDMSRYATRIWVQEIIDGLELKGDKGERGDMGPMGPQGLQGIQGIQGPKGDPGTGIGGKVVTNVVKGGGCDVATGNLSPSGGDGVLLTVTFSEGAAGTICIPTGSVDIDEIINKLINNETFINNIKNKILPSITEYINNYVENYFDTNIDEYIANYYNSHPGITGVRTDGVCGESGTYLLFTHSGGNTTRICVPGSGGGTGGGRNIDTISIGAPCNMNGTPIVTDGDGRTVTFVFTDGTSQSICMPKGEKGNQGDRGDRGDNGDPGKQGNSAVVGGNACAGKPNGGTSIQFKDGDGNIISGSAVCIENGAPGKNLEVTRSVPTCDDLPASANIGDTYLVIANGRLYFWGETGFPKCEDGVPFQGKDGADGTNGTGFEAYAAACAGSKNGGFGIRFVNADGTYGATACIENGADGESIAFVDDPNCDGVAVNINGVKKCIVNGRNGVDGLRGDDGASVTDVNNGGNCTVNGESGTYLIFRYSDGTFTQICMPGAAGGEGGTWTCTTKDGKPGIWVTGEKADPATAAIIFGTGHCEPIRGDDGTGGGIKDIRTGDGCDVATGNVAPSGGDGIFLIFTLSDDNTRTVCMPRGPRGDKGNDGIDGQDGRSVLLGGRGCGSNPGTNIQVWNGTEYIDQCVRDGKNLEVTRSVPTCDDLPASANLGDTYLVIENGRLYFWGATGFPKCEDGVPFQGKDGADGLPGVDGNDGMPGVSVTGVVGGDTCLYIICDAARNLDGSCAGQTSIGDGKNVTFTFSDGSTNSVCIPTPMGPKGDQGDPGENGSGVAFGGPCNDGNGIELVYSNDRIVEKYCVTNGADGLAGVSVTSVENGGSCENNGNLLIFHYSDGHITRVCVPGSDGGGTNGDIEACQMDNGARGIRIRELSGNWTDCTSGVRSCPLDTIPVTYGIQIMGPGNNHGACVDISGNGGGANGNIRDCFLHDGLKGIQVKGYNGEFGLCMGGVATCKMQDGTGLGIRIISNNGAGGVEGPCEKIGGGSGGRFVTDITTGSVCNMNGMPVIATEFDTGDGIFMIFHFSDGTETSICAPRGPMGLSGADGNDGVSVTSVENGGSCENNGNLLIFHYSDEHITRVCVPGSGGGGNNDIRTCATDSGAMGIQIINPLNGVYGECFSGVKSCPLDTSPVTYGIQIMGPNGSGPCTPIGGSGGDSNVQYCLYNNAFDGIQFKDPVGGFGPCLPIGAAQYCSPDDVLPGIQFWNRNLNSYGKCYTLGGNGSCEGCKDGESVVGTRTGRECEVTVYGELYGEKGIEIFFRLSDGTEIYPPVCVPRGPKGDPGHSVEVRIGQDYECFDSPGYSPAGNTQCIVFRYFDDVSGEFKEVGVVVPIGPEGRSVDRVADEGWCDVCAPGPTKPACAGANVLDGTLLAFYDKENKLINERICVPHGKQGVSVTGATVGGLCMVGGVMISEMRPNGYNLIFSFSDGSEQTVCVPLSREITNITIVSAAPNVCGNSLPNNAFDFHFTDGSNILVCIPGNFNSGVGAGVGGKACDDEGKEGTSVQFKDGEGNVVSEICIEAGRTGPVGPEGPAGPEGKEGPIGPEGPMGPMGLAGNDGPTIVPCWVDGVEGYRLVPVEPAGGWPEGLVPGLGPCIIPVIVDENKDDPACPWATAITFTTSDSAAARRKVCVPHGTGVRARTCKSINDLPGYELVSEVDNFVTGTALTECITKGEPGTPGIGVATRACKGTNGLDGYELIADNANPLTAAALSSCFTSGKPGVGVATRACKGTNGLDGYELIADDANPATAAALSSCLTSGAGVTVDAADPTCDGVVIVSGATRTCVRNGLKGETGNTGAVGATGPAGEKGDTGAQGPIGLAGATGAQGPAGKDGAPGINAGIDIETKGGITTVCPVIDSIKLSTGCGSIIDGLGSSEVQSMISTAVNAVRAEIMQDVQCVNTGQCTIGGDGRVTGGTVGVGGGGDTPGKS